MRTNLPWKDWSEICGRNTMSRHAFIVGGTGQIGRAVAADLLERGWRVTASHRGNRRMPSDLIERGAKIIVSDRETPGELARALSSGADAVIDAIAFRPDHARELIEVQDNVRKPSSSSPHPASIATPSAELSTKLRRMVFQNLPCRLRSHIRRSTQTAFSWHSIFTSNQPRRQRAMSRECPGSRIEASRRITVCPPLFFAIFRYPRTPRNLWPSPRPPTSDMR
jgi:hypothetical protein